MTAPLIALAQVAPRKADYDENIRRIGHVLSQLAVLEDAPEVVVFPETMTTGYFLEGGVQDGAVTAGTLLADLTVAHRRAGVRPVDVVIGFYEIFRNQYYNSAMYASLGAASRILHVHRKIFLPTYGVFDEQRFVRSGHAVRAFDTSWGRAAILICEDAWHSLVPTIAALDGAQVLFVPSASPARGVTPARVTVDAGRETLPSSLERWEMTARAIAGEHGVFVCMCQLIGFEGGKGFPGASVIAGPDGVVRARGPLFEESIILHRCNTKDITRTRGGSPLLADLERELPHLLGARQEGAAHPIEYDEADRQPREPKRETGKQFRVVTAPGTLDPLAIDPELAANWLVAFIREEVVTRRGFKKGIVGLSGGVDSSLTAHLAVRALGNENVIGVRMPYSASSEESLTHAELVANQLGIRLETVNITAAVDGYASVAPKKPDPQRLGNVMARVRMVTLFDLSAAFEALPLGTGNKTERLLGYFTWHADDSPPVNPLGDLMKTQVWALARHIGVPEEIITKPATADLVRGQTDEKDLGVSYPKADLILHWLLDGLDVFDIVALGFSQEEVRLVHQRLSSTHWKRRLPTVAMVSQTAIGEYYLRPVDY